MATHLELGEIDSPVRAEQGQGRGLQVGDGGEGGEDLRVLPERPVVVGRESPRGRPYCRRWGPSPATARPGSLWRTRSEEHTSELQSLRHLVCRLLLEKKKKT